MEAPKIASLRAPLLAGAGQLGLALTATEADALLGYLGHIRTWNRVYNLTAIRELPAMLTQHVLDCLAVVPALRRHAGEAPVHRLLDVGSGAGLPAVVLAVLQPAIDVVSVDAVGKKAAFVQQIAGALRLDNLKAVHARVEHLPQDAPFDVVTARAFASLAEFVALTRPLLAAGGVWMALKGKRPDAEIAALPADVSVFHVEPLSVPGLEAKRCLVWMRPGK